MVLLYDIWADEILVLKSSHVSRQQSVVRAEERKRVNADVAVPQVDTYEYVQENRSGKSMLVTSFVVRFVISPRVFLSGCPHTRYDLTSFAICTDT